MLPTLRPGDGLIAVRWRRVRTGQIRCFEHPQRPGFWLVKRVAAIDRGRFEACSDNPHVGAVDSRHFGSVSGAASYRLVLTVPRRLLGGGRDPTG